MTVTGWPVPFGLTRRDDPSEVSGTGTVASGVIWDDGLVSMRWISPRPPAGYHRVVNQVTLYPCVEDMMAIHGHQGATVLTCGDPTERHRTWRLSLFALVTGQDQVAAWGVSWSGGGPAVTVERTVADRDVVRRLSHWPEGALAAAAELRRSRDGELRQWWLPTDVERIQKICSPAGLTR